jgi:hypothetical protein
MTFEQMFNLSNSLLDKVGSPYFTESEFDDFCNIAYNDWIEQEYNKFEINHEHSVKLDRLLVPYTKIGTEIFLTTDITNFRYLARINGEFNDTCDGLVTRNIRQAKNNNIDVLKQDPFNRPTTKEPLFFITAGPKIEVLPTANRVNIVYVRDPQKINSDTNPTGVFELPDYLAEEIVEMAVRKQDVNTENYNQANAINNEIAQRNGVFE